jgi:glycosyltransferase involved in cell wall biosynthesis
MFSPRYYIRRFLGRRGTFFLRNMLSEFSFKLGVYKGPREEGKEPGISAMVCTYNEEDWIVPSMLSIENLVDEYIVVDSSTDKTLDLIQGLKEERGLNVRIFRIPPGSLSEARNLALKEAKFKWVLHWDADFVMFDWASNFVKDFTSSLDPRRHHLVYWPWICLCGDLRHLCGRDPYHVEHWLFTYSSSLVYKDLFIRGTPMDHLIAPLKLFKAIYIDRVLGLHLKARRNLRRLALKQLWWKFRKEFQEGAFRGLSYEEIAKRKALELNGTDDLEEVGRRILGKQVTTLPMYDGEYPSVLIPYIE